jgi:hypothetical protein
MPDSPRSIAHDLVNEAGHLVALRTIARLLAGRSIREQLRGLRLMVQVLFARP